MNPVHQFLAESNLICNLCINVLDMKQEGNITGIRDLFNEFPMLEQKFHQAHYFTESSQYSKYQSHEYTCESIGFCQSGEEQFLQQDSPLDMQIHIDFVNGMNSTWKAGRNSKFEGMSLYEIKQLMGTVVDHNWISKSPSKYSDNLSTVPEFFSVSTNWSECQIVVNHVRDQSNSGLCWAHGTTEALNDRLCIASEGSFQKLLSISDTAGCCSVLNCFSFGVNGGQVSTPWRWFTNVGVVSGGDYGDNQLCYDYTMSQCNHHSGGSQLPSCDQVQQVAPKCLDYCKTTPSIDYHSDKHKAKSHYHLVGVDAIKQDLVNYGTVTAAFTVYEDFLTYQSGVYQHLSGQALGGHATVIQGFGVENGTEYWFCKNSWNSEWGDNGFFKIKIGDSGINDSVYAGLV